MKITVLSGVSGVGKTYLRTTDEWLSKLPFIDIADIYDEIAQDETGLLPLDWHTAFAMLSERIVAHKKSGTSYLVVEGYFMPESPSRVRLGKLCRVHNIGLEYVYLWDPIEVCHERLTSQWEELDSDEQSRLFDKFVRRHYLLTECWKPLEWSDLFVVTDDVLLLRGPLMPRTLVEALRQSVKKWEAIVEYNIELAGGTSTCGLCKYTRSCCFDCVYDCGSSYCAWYMDKSKKNAMAVLSELEDLLQKEEEKCSTS